MREVTFKGARLALVEPPIAPGGPLSLGTVAVSGDSMNPTYREGDWLLVRWKPDFNIGDVVVIERQERPGVYLIKRFLREVDGLIWVEGDNPAGTDSRQWGAIDQSEVVGKVLFRLRRAINSRKK